MYRISKEQIKEADTFAMNLLLNLIDDLIYSEQEIIKNDKIFLSIANQVMLIEENITTFADIASVGAEIAKLTAMEIVLIDSITKEEKIVNVEIEGGI
jgi:hypothetical protein